MQFYKPWTWLYTILSINIIWYNPRFPQWCTPTAAETALLKRPDNHLGLFSCSGQTASISNFSNIPPVYNWNSLTFLLADATPIVRTALTVCEEMLEAPPHPGRHAKNKIKNPNAMVFWGWALFCFRWDIWGLFMWQTNIWWKEEEDRK